jgi:hypothetical protein
MKLMKFQHSLSACLFLLTLASAFAQQPPSGAVTQPGVQAPALTKFDLDFPGGTPKQLIAAIQKACGRPLNAIVPEEFADTNLPGLNMKNVDVQQLFQALTAANRNGGCGFISQGKPSDDAIWTFVVDRHSSPKACRFYSLARYLASGTTVDDITTAIKTGAQMLGEGPGPAISFHKDTKLLIAVGEPSKLEIIDSVLRALDSQAQSVGHSGRADGRNEPPKDEKK